MLFWIILGVILVIIISGVRIVSQSRAMVIERLGAYHRTLQTGLHYHIPFIERIANHVSLKEIVKDFAPQPVITKDNVTMQIDTVVYFQITDPKLYTYGVENPVNAIENLTATTLRNIIGELELDETLTSRDIINSKMRAILDEATDVWGCKIDRVEIKDITPPADIRDAMEKQMNAERDKRALILQAEGERQSAITLAEGKKEAAILEAEADKESKIRRATGEAEAIKKVAEAKAEEIHLVYDAMMKSNPSDKLVQLKSLEALKEVAQGEANKIFIPFEATKALSGLGSVSEIFKDKKSDK